MGSDTPIDILELRFEYEPAAGRGRRRHPRRLLHGPCATSRAPLPLASISATRLPPQPASITSQGHSAPPPQPSNNCTTLLPGPVLPVGLKGGPTPRRYLWDGRRLVAVDLADLSATAAAAGGHGQAPLPSPAAVAARWAHSAYLAFFPHPSEVTPDYWEWCKWRGVHRLFSSMASVFGTQSLLLAVGVGAKRSLPAAAAINWVLKDGLGRLGRLSVATRFGESFDSDLKRFRYSSSLLYAAALCLDYMTPLAPSYFLPMAALANVGKSVGLTTYISTQPAFHRSFAVSENLADISAKTQAQQMAVDTLGLALAVAASAACAARSEAARRALPLAALPFLAGGDLIAISNELRSIHLRTLNKERAEILAAEWVAARRVLTPLEVSARERLVLPPPAALGLLPLTIGGLDAVLTGAAAVESFIGAPPKRRYALTADPPAADTFEYMVGKGFGGALRELKRWVAPAAGRGAVRAALRADASPADVLEVVLTAAKLREAAAAGRGEKDAELWIAEARVAAAKEVGPLTRSLEAAGWQAAPFLLSSAEKKYYCSMTD
jgi:hypothetical protein